VAVLLDVDQQVAERDEANNGFGFNAGCLIDSGPVLVPEDK